MSDGSRAGDRITLAALAAAVVVLYFPAFGRWMVGDDSRNQVWAVFGGFQIFLDKGRFFRPFENLVNAANTALFGPDVNWLNVAVGLAGLIAMAHLVMKTARALDPGDSAYPKLAAAFVALNSIAVSASIQIDTICTQYATVFSLTAVWWILAGPDRRPTVWLGVAFSVLLLALLAKESAGGIVAGIPILVVLLRGHSAALERVDPGRLATRFALLIAAVLVSYVALRWLAGTEAWGGSGSSNARIVVNPVRWLMNGAVLVAPVFYVGSTLDVFPWISPMRLAVSALLTAPLVVVAAMGVWSLGRDRSPRDLQLVVGLVLLIAASLFPHALLGHVSETWSTGPLPFGSLLLWMLVLRGWRALRIGPALRVAAVSYLVVAGCWMAFGVREKIDLSASVAANSRHLFEQAQQVLARTDGDVSLCVSDEVNANGRRIDRRLAFEQQPGLSPYRLQRNSARYNVFYDIPSDVLANVVIYLQELHADREIAVLAIVGPMAAKTAESHDCALLKLLEPTAP